MSPKVQHIPPSGHLSTASLALLMAGQSLTTQYLSGVDIRGLVLADIAASLLLVTMDRGAGEISTAFSLNQSFADILTGIILFFIIATEFFITYKVTLRKSSKKEA